MNGVYILVIELPVAAEIHTLRRSFLLDKGFYAYIGSAMNGLEARIRRHLSPDKKHHWHIDFLLDKSKIRAVVSAQTGERMECKIADHFSDLESLIGFGSSDCQCRSHLFYASDLERLISHAQTIFTHLGLRPVPLLI
jgi:Uri superfamily endonuclease